MDSAGSVRDARSGDDDAAAALQLDTAQPAQPGAVLLRPLRLRCTAPAEPRHLIDITALPALEGGQLVHILDVHCLQGCCRPLLQPHASIAYSNSLLSLLQDGSAWYTPRWVCMHAGTFAYLDDVGLAARALQTPAAMSTAGSHADTRSDAAACVSFRHGDEYIVTVAANCTATTKRR